METTATACAQNTGRTRPQITEPSPALLASWSDRIEQACAQACQAIAPAWPLDQAIAVNPHFKRISMPVRTVAARMAVLGDIKVFPERAYIRQAWQKGRISTEDLQQALIAVGKNQGRGPANPLTPRQCIHALTSNAAVPRLPLLMDVLDDDPQRHTRLTWRQAITHQISQTCAAYFDRHLAHWQPQRDGGLYAFWRETLQQDHGIGILMGLPDLGKMTHALPETPQEARTWVLDRIGLPETVWADYLEAVLLTVNGWASWCAYLEWQARLERRTDSHLAELLAIRLAWGALLLECKSNASAQRAFSAMQAQWRRAPEQLDQAANTLLIDEVWQTALELGYQRSLFKALQANSPGGAQASQTIEAQAVFCIDVRSEPMRRALESVWPGIQTRGFAGFFGLPVAYTPLGTAIRRAQLPGLLAPAMEMTDVVMSSSESRLDRDTANSAGSSNAQATQQAAKARQRRFAMFEPLHAATRWPSAAFSFVETAGMGYLGQLGRWVLPSSQPRVNDDHAGMPRELRHTLRPALTGLDVDAKVMLAARVLQAMGLELGMGRSFAPLILLVGHASQSANNAQSAALDCGACCGQSGQSNARALALLLNEPAVREGLRAQQIDIPPETFFIGALHNTTTDEVECFDEDLLPHDAQKTLDQLHKALSRAGHKVRLERARSLDLSADSNESKLLMKFRKRANDGAQTRPEWGLAGNAAIVFAPRQRTRGLNLEGRVFLHDYDASQDLDGTLLESLMTAPMLVAHWINWQYHASTCDPQRLGSGNKLLHNVVGGHIGVFEGNGGDLRIGLSRQSLHDGKQWVHEPVRLTVAIEASLESIQKAIEKHPVVQQMVDNRWLHIWHLERDGQMLNCIERADT